MLGLRSAGHLAGFTRLSDEFLMALDHVHEAGAFDDESRALSFFDEAVRRVRSFARGGEAVGGFERAPSGLLVFELQGYDYAASFARVELERSASFDSLREPLERECARADEAAVDEQVPIGLVLAVVREAEENDLRRLLEEARHNEFTHALAYALPSDPREREATWAQGCGGVMLLGRCARPL